MNGLSEIAPYGLLVQLFHTVYMGVLKTENLMLEWGNRHAAQKLFKRYKKREGNILLLPSLCISVEFHACVCFSHNFIAHRNTVSDHLWSSVIGLEVSVL